MNIDEIKMNKNENSSILQKYGVKRASIFGSAVRDEMREDSELEDILGRKVDLVEFDRIVRGSLRSTMGSEGLQRW